MSKRQLPTDRATDNPTAHDEATATPVPEPDWKVDWLTREELDARYNLGLARHMRVGLPWPCDHRYDSWKDYLTRLRPCLADADLARLEMLRADVIATSRLVTGVDHMEMRGRSIPFVGGSFVHTGADQWAELMAAIWTSAGAPSDPQQWRGDEVDGVFVDRVRSVLICVTAGDGSPITLCVSHSIHHPDFGYVIVDCHMRDGGEFLLKFLPGDPVVAAIRDAAWVEVTRLALREWRCRAPGG